MSSISQIPPASRYDPGGPFPRRLGRRPRRGRAGGLLVEPLEGRVLPSAGLAHPHRHHHLPGRFASARPLTLDDSGSAEQPGTIVAAGDRVAYSFVAPFSGGLMVSVGAAGPGLDTVLTVFGSIRRKLAANDNAGPDTTDSLVRLNVVEGHRYFIRVSGFATSAGDFLLSLSEGPPFADDYGNTPADAHPVALAPTHTSVPGSIETTNDVDVFRFVAPATGRLELQVDPASGSELDGSIAVLDGALHHLRTTPRKPLGPGSPVGLNVAAGQTYYVKVAARPHLGAPVGDYTLVFDLGPLRKGGPGNPVAGARPIALGAKGRATINGSLAASGHLDLFSFQAPRPGILTVQQVAADGAMPGLALAVLRGSVPVAAANSGPGVGGVLAQFKVVTGPTYYMGVRTIGGPSRYRLTLQLESFDSHHLAVLFAQSEDFRDAALVPQTEVSSPPAISPALLTSGQGGPSVPANAARVVTNAGALAAIVAIVAGGGAASWPASNRPEAESRGFDPPPPGEAAAAGSEALLNSAFNPPKAGDGGDPEAHAQEVFDGMIQSALPAPRDGEGPPRPDGPGTPADGTAPEPADDLPLLKTPPVAERGSDAGREEAAAASGHPLGVAALAAGLWRAWPDRPAAPRRRRRPPGRSVPSAPPGPGPLRGLPR
jgi:hypothetical protein